MTKIIVIICCLVGFVACSSVSYEKERIALDSATTEESSAALDLFIQTYPKSVFIPTAVYRRDRAALEEAKRIGTKEALQLFLERYPKSDWADQARYFLEYEVPKKQNGG